MRRCSVLVVMALAGASAMQAQTEPRPEGEVLRERVTGIDLDALETVRAAAGTGAPAPLALDLFPDARFNAMITWTGPTAAGYALTGHLVEWELGSVTLVVHDQIVLGTIRAPDGVYTITALDGAEAVVRKSMPRPQRRQGDAIQPQREDLQRRSSAAPVPGGREDGSQIDVLMTFTPSAVSRIGGRQMMDARVALVEATANQAYRDSGAQHQLRVVHSTTVQFREEGLTHHKIIDMLTDPSDGRMDRVHALRDRYAADLVTLVVDHELLPDGASAGVAILAWHPERPAWSEGGFNTDSIYDYNATDPAFGATTFSHEVGHNMGLNHERYQDCRGEAREWCGSEGVATPYAFGYLNRRMFDVDAPTSSRWWTIMAYGTECYDHAEAEGLDGDAWCWVPGGRILRFSNPARRYRGDPTGVPGTQRTRNLRGPADARRTMNRARRDVANWRTAPCLRNGDRVRLQASNGQYLVAAGNGGGAVAANQPRPGPRGRFTLVDHNGGCVVSGDTVSLHTSDGFYIRAARGGGGAVDATAPRATPWARFVARRERTRRHAVRIHDTISLQTRTSGHYVVAEEGGGGDVRADRTAVGAWERWRLTAIR